VIQRGIELKITRTQKDLRNGLLHMLKIKNYHDITISEICKFAGYNRGTFYNNFNNKDNLLEFLIDSRLNEMVLHLNKSYFPYETYSSTLLIFKTLFDNGDFFQSLLNNNTIIDFRYKTYEALLNGHYKKVSDIPQNLEKYESIEEFYYSYVGSAMMGITMYWIKDGMKKSPEYLTEKFLEIVDTRPHDLILGKIPFRSSRNNDKKLDPRVARSKTALKNALIMLMQNKKYSQIKIAEIIQLAEYNRSTFYAHFDSKDHLYKYMINDLTTGMTNSILPLNINHNKLERKSSNSPILRLFNYLYDNRYLLNILYTDKNVPGFFNEIYTSLCQFFIEELNEREKIDTEMYAHYLTSTLLNTKGVWFSSKLQYSPLYVAELYEDLLKTHPVEKEI